MNQRIRAKVLGFFLVLVFLVLAIGYYFVYQKFTEERSEPRYTIVDDRPVVTEGLNFRGDVKRFLTVYNEQEFVSKQDLYNFLMLEMNRFSLYPVETQLDIVMKENLVKNINSILQKMGQENANVDVEREALLEILKTLN